ncbi:MAG: hypothetical protein MUC48_10425 [Leptolyngbya sp. Prado105]|jgi:hypothetical protein|nr:hypothetical protein [Leptolyngbya sp. Prado105]
MNTPNVTSFSALDQQGHSTRFTVSTDIIDYMASARTFGREDLADPQQQGRFQRRVIAMPDRRSAVLAPMVLTIGNRNQLSLVRQDSKGWQRIDLLENVHVMGAAWTDDDRMTIAVAISDKAQPSISRVFVAYNLSSQNTDWTNIPWVDCGTRASLKLSAIRVLDEGDRWTIVLSGDQGANDSVYLMRRGQLFNQAFVFNPAVTLQEIFDFEVGVHPIFGAGLHVLGTSGGKRVLSFRPFPTYNSAGRIISTPPVVVLPCPAGATVLESSLTRDGASDLYIAGQGTQLISANEQDNAAKAKVEAIVPAQLAPNVEDLVVGDSPEGVAVWTLLQNGDLNIVKRSTHGWSAPLRLRQDVQEIAPIQGDEHTTTSLLIVYTNSRASYLWQDAGTGVWQETPILVADSGELTRVPCYGTSLRVLDDAGMPQPNRKVTVSASVLCSVVLNSETVFVSPNVSIETETDANGAVSLFDAVRSLTPALYRFSIENIKDAIEINPAAGVHDRFKQITANELRSATFTTPEGTAPLLPESFRTGADRAQVDAIAASLNQVAKLTNSTTGVISGVRQVAANLNYGSALRLDAVPQNYQWGIEATAQGVKPASLGAIDRLLKSKSVGEFFTNLGESIVDFFEGVGDRIKAGALFVIRKAEEAFEFVCQLGDKIKRFILKTVEEVGAFFGWLWEQVETGAEKVWEFLKFAFDWNDILIVRDAMVDATDEALKYFQASISSLKPQVNKGFDVALDQIDTWRTAAGVSAKKLPPVHVGTSVLDDLKAATAPIQALMDQATGNSVIAWVNERIKSVASEIISIESANPATEAVEAAESFIKGLLSDGADNLFNCWQQIEADLEELFNYQLPTGKDLNFNLIRNVLIAVGANALSGLLEMLRDLLLRAIDLMKDLIGVVRDTLFLKVRFPFIEKLVKMFFPNVNIDTSFRLIDGLMLLFAIPGTITYKLMFGKAPLKQGEKLVLPFQNAMMVQSGIEDIKKYAWIATIVGAFAKSGVALVQAATAKDKSKLPAALTLGLAAVFGGVGLAAEIFGRRDKSRFSAASRTGLEALEWIMISVTGLITLKGVALAITSKFKDADTVKKIDSGFEAILYPVHFLFQTAAFGIVIDNDRKANDHNINMRQLPESFVWVTGLFDKGGSALFATAGTIDDVKVKVILTATGAISKGVAFVTTLGGVAAEISI